MNIKKTYKYFNEGLMIIISSPSGAGKTTLCQKISSIDRKINLSISYTTRKKRKSEVNGQHYLFISKNKFLKMKNSKKLLEYAKVFGNNYGTPIENIKTKIKSKKDVLFDIDWQGAKQIRKKFPNNVVDIFILPPSIKELKSRLMKRGQDDIAIVKKRMKMALDEIYHFHEYKYVLINDDFSKTIRRIMNIINLERNLRKDLNATLKILKKNSIR